MILHWGPENRRGANDPYVRVYWMVQQALGVKQLRADKRWYVMRLGKTHDVTLGCDTLEQAKVLAEMLVQMEII